MSQALPQRGVLYGYRIDGPQNEQEGHGFDRNIIQIDPYAKFIEGRRLFGDPDKKLSKFLGTYDFEGPSFDWGDHVHTSIPEVYIYIYVFHAFFCFHFILNGSV